MNLPLWLSTLALISLISALLCAAAIAFDEICHPQKMWIMNLVWPLSALYASLAALWGYFAVGRKMAKDRMQPAHRHPSSESHASAVPWRQIAVSATHCGVGCILADIVGENLVFANRWSLGGQSLYADYAVTLGFAWLFGVAFQYFSIRPMENLSPLQALMASIKADTLSILFFQIGMYGWMAVTYFLLFPHPHLEPDSPLFWFMMQIGMLLGYCTTFPVNAWLLHLGVKKGMG